jgi:hypothetical protein
MRTPSIDDGKHLSLMHFKNKLTVTLHSSHNSAEITFYFIHTKNPTKGYYHPLKHD